MSDNTFIHKLDELMRDCNVPYPSQDSITAFCNGISHLAYYKEYMFESDTDETGDKLNLGNIFTADVDSNFDGNVKISQDDILNIMIPDFEKSSLGNKLLKRDVNILNESYWLLYILSSRYAQVVFDIVGDILTPIKKSYMSDHPYALGEFVAKSPANIPKYSTFQKYIDAYNDSFVDYIDYNISTLILPVNKDGYTIMDDLLPDLIEDVMDTYVIHNKDVAQSLYSSMMDISNNRLDISRNFVEILLLSKQYTATEEELELQSSLTDEEFLEDQIASIKPKIRIINVSRILECKDNVVTDKLLHVISTDYNTSLFSADNILAFNSKEKLLYLIEKMETLLNLNIASIPVMASSVFSLKGGKDTITDSTVLSQQILSEDKINSDLINNSITKLHNLWYYSIPIFIEQYFDIAMNLLESDVEVVQIFIPDVIVTEENVEEIILTNNTINEITHPDVYKSFIRMRDEFNAHPKPSFLKYSKELFESSIISH